MSVTALILLGIAIFGLGLILGGASDDDSVVSIGIVLVLIAFLVALGRAIA